MATSKTIETMVPPVAEHTVDASAAAVYVDGDSYTP